ncbi:MAG: hypothetical protein ACREUV_00705, partial [Burkholderiales bacterium]
MADIQSPWVSSLLLSVLFGVFVYIISLVLMRIHLHPHLKSVVRMLGYFGWLIAFGAGAFVTVGMESF